MCGRFYIQETSLEIRKIVQRIQGKMNLPDMKTGEIYPSESVPVLVVRDGKIVPEIITWGAPGFSKGSRIINARSETACEKKMFRDSILHRRCIVPANGFFEWNRLGDKKKYYFKDDSEDIIYMAGIYDRYEDTDYFIILTTNANDSMKGIHDRMPLILEREQIMDWLLDDGSTKAFLRRTPRELKREETKKEKKNEYEQLTFDWTDRTS